MDNSKHKKIVRNNSQDVHRNMVSLERGREALKAYRQKRPVRDLAVMDLSASRQNRMWKRKLLQVIKPAAIVAWSRNVKQKNKSEQSE